MQRTKILLIVESPKKVATITKFLQDDKNCEYKVLATKGHLTELSKNGKYKMGVDIDNGFKPQYIISQDKFDLYKAICDSLLECDECVICTDGDREGEVIAQHILDRISTYQKPIYRAIFDEITESGIRRGLKNKRTVDSNLAKAGIARRVLDRIVGYMASPYVMDCVNNKASAGRVQSVALKLIVDREREIRNFVPEEYWTIKAAFKKDEQMFTGILKSKSRLSKEDAQLIKSELDNSKFCIKSIKSKTNPKKPPPPLNTVSFQVMCSKKYGISPMQAMESAQTLYESGKITYMRTDSVRTSKEALDDVRRWLKQNITVPSKPYNYSNKNQAQDAHECIRPVSVDDRPKAKPKTNEEKVYDVIWRSFVASQMETAIFNNTTYTIKVGKHEINIYGKVLNNDDSWLLLLNDKDLTTDNIPKLNENEELVLAEPIIMEQKFTQPPTRYKIPTLIQELEKNGIGRPSTYATILDKISSERGFINTDKDNKVYATEFGEKVIDCLDHKFSFMNVNYTADIETKLDRIEDGSVSYIDVMSGFYDPFQKELTQIKTSLPSDTNYKCKKCNCSMNLKYYNDSHFLQCAASPICDFKDPVWFDNKILFSNSENKKSDVVCFYCGGDTSYKIYKNHIYCKCMNCNKNSYIAFDESCPKCDGKVVIKPIDNNTSKLECVKCGCFSQVEKSKISKIFDDIKRKL